MTKHLASQRIMIPGSQVSALTTGNITLTGARKKFAAPLNEVHYLVVAGGGGGGSQVGGGGGAGGYRTSVGGSSFLTLSENTSYTVTVGAGGAGGDAASNGVANSKC